MMNGRTNSGPLVLCTECYDTGLIELVMSDDSREPWPCFYCEAGARIREARDRAGSAPPGAGDKPASGPGAPLARNNTGEESSQGATTMTNTERQAAGTEVTKATEGQAAVPAQANRPPDITGLLKPKDRAKGHEGLAPEAPTLRQKVRLFSRKEKEAVLLSFLLSERIREDQLDSIIDLLVTWQ